MFGILLAVAVTVAAGWILLRRVHRFCKTRGQSGCENCPYAQGCSRKEK